jgi:hypothetical protein
VSVKEKRMPHLAPVTFINAQNARQLSQVISMPSRSDTTAAIAARSVHQRRLG